MTNETKPLDSHLVEHGEVSPGVPSHTRGCLDGRSLLQRSPGNLRGNHHRTPEDRIERLDVHNFRHLNAAGAKLAMELRVRGEILGLLLGSSEKEQLRATSQAVDLGGHAFLDPLERHWKFAAKRPPDEGTQGLGIEVWLTGPGRTGRWGGQVT